MRKGFRQRVQGAKRPASRICHESELSCVEVKQVAQMGLRVCPIDIILVTRTADVPCRRYNHVDAMCHRVSRVRQLPALVFYRGTHQVVDVISIKTKWNIETTCISVAKVNVSRCSVV